MNSNDKMLLVDPNSIADSTYTLMNTIFLYMITKSTILVKAKHIRESVGLKSRKIQEFMLIFNNLIKRGVN